MRNAFAGLEFSQSDVDFGQENEPLDSILKGRILRQILERLDDPVSRRQLWHGFLLLKL